MPASLLRLLGCTRRGIFHLAKPRARCQSPLLLQVVRAPLRPGHQVAGSFVLLPVLDLARPAEGKAASQGLCHEAGHPQLEQGCTRATSIPGSEAASRTSPSTTHLWALAGSWHGPALAQQGGKRGPQFWGLRRFNARPCQMVQDQRRFNLLPSSQLPHPSLSPAPPEPRVLSSPLLPHQGAGEGDGLTTGNPARRCWWCGPRHLSTSQRQHNAHQHFLHQCPSHQSCRKIWRGIRGEPAVLSSSGTPASLGPFTASSGEVYCALGSREHWGLRGDTGGLWGGTGGAAGDTGVGGRIPLPCAVPLVPAARAPLGRLCATHPAAGLVGGQSLYHIQAVGLCPPAAGREGVRLLVRNCCQAASCPRCTLPPRGHPQPVPQSPPSSQC